MSAFPIAQIPCGWAQRRKSTTQWPAADEGPEARSDEKVAEEGSEEARERPPLTGERRTSSQLHLLLEMKSSMHR